MEESLNKKLGLTMEEETWQALYDSWPGDNMSEKIRDIVEQACEEGFVLSHREAVQRKYKKPTMHYMRMAYSLWDQVEGYALTEGIPPSTWIVRMIEAWDRGRSFNQGASNSA